MGGLAEEGERGSLRRENKMVESGGRGGGWGSALGLTNGTVHRSLLSVVERLTGGGGGGDGGKGGGGGEGGGGEGGLGQTDTRTKCSLCRDKRERERESALERERETFSLFFDRRGETPSLYTLYPKSYF